MITSLAGDEVTGVKLYLIIFGILLSSFRLRISRRRSSRSVTQSLRHQPSHPDLARYQPHPMQKVLKPTHTQALTSSQLTTLNYSHATSPETRWMVNILLFNYCYNIIVFLSAKLFEQHYK